MELRQTIVPVANIGTQAGIWVVVFNGALIEITNITKRAVFLFLLSFSENQIRLLMLFHS
jgi:Zn-dependent membrane protease YugP